MKKKVIIAILAIIILAGIIVSAVFGFNKSVEYGYSTKIFINFSEGFQIADVEGIVKEVFGEKEFKIDYNNEFESGVVIYMDSADDEQVNSFRDKLIERYEKFTAEDTSFLNVVHVAPVKTFDLVKIFIKPVAITLGISIAFLIIMSLIKRKNICKGLIFAIISIFVANALYISIIAIFRIPVSEYIISIGLLVYAISLMYASIYTTKKLNVIKK